MSKFDAAIIGLRDYAMSYSAAIIPGALDSVTAAIRVLEAAGKVSDKKYLMEYLEHEMNFQMGQENPRVYQILSELRALLEALPDEEVMP